MSGFSPASEDIEEANVVVKEKEITRKEIGNIMECAVQWI